MVCLKKEPGKTRPPLFITLLLNAFLLNASVTLASDHDSVPSPPSTALPVLQLPSPIPIPLDERLVQPLEQEFAFLSTLDSAAKPVSFLLLEGSTLYSGQVAGLIRQNSFDIRYAGRQVVIEGSLSPDPAPLPKHSPNIVVLDNVRNPTPADEQRIETHRSQRAAADPCLPSLDKNTLIRLGNRKDGFDHKLANECFRMALSQSPESIAALNGEQQTCDEKNEPACRRTALAKIVALRPDYYQARITLAYADGSPSDERQTIIELKRLLDESPPPPIQIQILDWLAWAAARDGKLEEEILYRRESSETARHYFALYPGKFGTYSRISIVFNDEPLAIALEGRHRWADAEEIYRRNLAMITVDPLFERETRFDNELGLARALAKQGNAHAARTICSNSKWTANFTHESGWQGRSNKAVMQAKWDLSCGKEQEGLALLQKETTTHAWNAMAYDALRDYYYASGDVQNALKAEELSRHAQQLADARTFSFMR
jgi:hypothetical protein